MKFEQLALEHLDAVYRMALHLARNPDEANELVQEVYARAFRPQTIERFVDKSADDDPTSGSGGMRSWLFTITHNVFYSRIKKQSRQPMAVEEFYGESSDETLPDEAPPVWDRSDLDWEHVDGKLKAAIDELKDEYREVLLMWSVDGLKYREIANIVGVPIGTVMSRLHRARKLLSDRLMADEQLVDELGLRVIVSENE
ncbi:MAG: sigma-70 family RNA polymerase sigma factor [Phycisphaerales bacterium]|nr:sigma-70 family RNA polymerase sigma factor [Phycisphaerales bacterium]